jgi:hypothetical protein
MNFADIKDLDKDDLFAAVGLSIKRTTTERVLEATAFLGVGLLVGAGLALLLAPKSGKGLREDISQKLGKIKNGRDTASSALSSEEARP